MRSDDITAQLIKARDYLLKSLGNDGLWRDFFTITNKEGIDWVTAYVGNSLCGHCDEEILFKVAKSLANRHNKIAPDADSTAFAIMFLSNFEEFKEIILPAKEFLLGHQRNSGGFATYNPNEVRTYHRIPETISVNGWCSELPETTATAVKALIKFDNPEEVRRGISYIQSQQVSGKWRSYWWNNDIYATVQCLPFVEDFNAKNLARKWLLESATKIPFYVGLSMTGLDCLEYTNDQNRILQPPQYLKHYPNISKFYKQNSLSQVHEPQEMPSVRLSQSCSGNRWNDRHMEMQAVRLRWLVLY
jgi:hypothetical protein